MKTLLLLPGIVLGISCITHAQAIEEEEPQQEYQEEKEFKSRRQKISLNEIPPPVKKGFANSKYSNMQIVEAHVLSAEAARKILEGTRDIEVITEETILYELKVEEGGNSALLYFTADGKLYNVAQEEGIG